MLLCPVCRENGVQRLRSCPWPLLVSGRWGLEIGCWPHKLIIVTKIVTRNVKYESYLEEDCKESLWCSIRKQSVYHDHLGLNQPWSTQSVCGLRTSPGLWEDETVWGEGSGDTAEHLCHPRLQPWRQARATGLSIRARKAPRTASDSNQHLPSTQLSVSVPERLRDLGPHDGINGKQKPSLDATATSHSRRYSVHQTSMCMSSGKWFQTPVAQSAFPHQQCSGATKEPSLVRNTRNLVLFRRGRQLGGQGQRTLACSRGLCHSRVMSATLCEGRAAPWALLGGGTCRGLSGLVWTHHCAQGLTVWSGFNSSSPTAVMQVTVPCGP